MTKPLCCLHPMIFHSVIHVWMCMPVGCNEAAYVVGQLSRHCEKQASMCMTLGQVQATLSTTWPAKFFVFCLRAARKCALRTWIWISLYNISLQLATVKHMWGVKYLFSVVVEKVSEQKGNLLTVGWIFLLPDHLGVLFGCIHYNLKPSKQNVAFPLQQGTCGI